MHRRTGTVARDVRTVSLAAPARRRTADVLRRVPGHVRDIMTRKTVRSCIDHTSKNPISTSTITRLSKSWGGLDWSRAGLSRSGPEAAVSPITRMREPFAAGGESEEGDPRGRAGVRPSRRRPRGEPSDRVLRRPDGGIAPWSCDVRSGGGAPSGAGPLPLPAKAPDRIRPRSEAARCLGVVEPQPSRQSHSSPADGRPCAGGHPFSAGTAPAGRPGPLPLP